MARVIPMMIWEAWRLTYRSLFLRVGIVSLIAVTLVNLSHQRVDGNGQNMVLFAVFSLVSLQAVLSSLYAKFGEDRPGFPFYLGYTQPVPTWLLVLVPMAYFALSMAAMYCFPVMLLVLIFDAQLPLLRGSILIGLIAILCATCNWWSMDKLQRGVGWLAVYLIIQQLVFRKASTPGSESGMFDLLTAATVFNYPGLVIAAIVAAGIAVLGVGKQRHGDAMDLSGLVSPHSLPAVKGLFRSGEILSSLEWLKGLYTSRCPTHSPVAAEVWREMKTRGVPVIAAGILVSLVVPVLWYLLNHTAVSGAVPKAPPGTPPAQLPLLFTMTVLPLSLPFFIATANLFGISKRQGHVDISKFDATLPIKTLHQISLRLLVAISSLIIAMLITGITLWNATPLLNDIYDYSTAKAAYAASLSAMTGFEIIQYAYVYMMQFITVTVCFGISQLLWVIYVRRILYGFLLFLVYLVFLVIGMRHEWFTLPAAVNQLWLIIAAVVFATAYVFFDDLRKHILTSGQAAAVFGAWLLFVPAFLSMQVSNGLLNFSMPIIVIAWIGMISVLPLTAAILAPWTVGKFRNR